MGLDAFARGWRQEVLVVLVIGVVSLVLWRVPVIGWVFYPFQLFVTYIHEICHGLAAILTGGRFLRFMIEPSGAGQALTAGGSRLIISSAGYVGSALFGGLLLIIASRPLGARAVLMGLGVGLALVCLLLARNSFGFLIGLLLAGGLMLASRQLNAQMAEWLLLFLAIQAILGALDSLFGLLQLSTLHRDVLTDAQIMAQATGIPAFFWSLLWSGISLLILWQALRLAYER